MRLIDADALLEEHCGACSLAQQKMCENDPVCGSAMWIVEAPTIEAEPVVHGRWIPHNKGQNNWCECSKCNTVGSPFWKRCPVCEAKMDGGEKDV